MLKLPYAKIGQIRSVTLGYSKGTNNTTDKRLFCSIILDRGSYEIPNVPFYGGGIDEDTGNPHGVFAPPRVNQKVLVFFRDAEYQDPVVATAIPHPFTSKGQLDDSSYYNLLDSVNDIAISHYTGTQVILRENGKIDIQKDISGNKRKITINIENDKITLESDLPVGIRGQTREVARKDDSIGSSITDDSTFWTWLSAAAIVLASLGVVAPTPTSLTGKITSGNSNVKTDG